MNVVLEEVVGGHKLTVVQCFAPGFDFGTTARLTAPFGLPPAETRIRTRKRTATKPCWQSWKRSPVKKNKRGFENGKS